MAERVTIEIRGVDRASGALRSVTGVLGRMSQIVGGLIAFRMFEKLGRALMGFGQAAMKAYEWFDRVRFSLQELARAEILDNMDQLTMTTSDWADVAARAGENAQALLDWVIKVALQSPFGAEDINRMFRLIRAYGFMTDEAKDLTETILGFASATGFGREVLERMGLALGQVRQRGRLAGEEIRQLINVGIPVRDIVAKALQITTAEFEKLLRKGKIMADVALPALVDWMNRFSGSSERAVQTWWGLLSNMKDVKELNLIALFEGIAKALTPALQSLFDYFTDPDFMEAVGKVGEGIGAFLTTLVEGIPAAISQLDTLAAFIKGIREGYISPGLALSYLLELMGVIEEADKPAIRAAINNFVDGLGRISDKIRDLAAIWVGPIVEQLPGWLDDIAGISWGTFIEFVPMFEGFVDRLIEMSGVAAPVILENLTDFLSNITEWWAGGAAEDAAEIVDFLMTIGSAAMLSGLVVFTGVIGALSDVLVGRDPTERLNKMLQAVVDLGTTVEKTETWEAASEAMARLAELSALEYTDVTEVTGRGVGDALIDGILAGVTDNEERVAADLTTFLDGFGYTASTWASLTGEQQMAMIGKQLISSLGQGFVTEAEAVEGRMEAVLERILTLVNEIYGIESPSKVFALIGKKMMMGLTAGIGANVKAAVEQIVSASRQVVTSAQRELGIASDSKVMAQMGADMLAGLARGLAGPRELAMAMAPAGGVSTSKSMHIGQLIVQGDMREIETQMATEDSLFRVLEGIL